MARAILIHWNAAEAGPLLAALRGPEVEAELCIPDGAAGLRPFDAAPPAAFVISLDRVPSRGRDVALFLRQRKATRGVPLVFAGGSTAAVPAIRKLLPDAHYTDWSGIRAVLAAALRETPSAPLVVPKAMAGYAGTPLPQKLGIKPGAAVVLLGAPPQFERQLEPLPEGAKLVRRARDASRVLLFTGSLRDLAKRFETAAAMAADGGGLWVIWPKRASRVQTDLTQAAVRRFGLDAGWVDYKICAVDETWSGLCFARRP
jgi:hypothetical protein